MMVYRKAASPKANPVMYVCVKSAVIKDKPDGNPMYTAKFGTRVSRDFNHEITDGRVYVKFYKRRRANYACYGWIPYKALTSDQIVNHAKLFYRNRMNRPVPVTDKRFGENVIGTVQPGARVKMIASVGPWCITDRGWSKFEWFEKDKTIDCQDDQIEKVWDAVIRQVVHDYTSSVKRIREKKYRSADDYKECVCTIMDINKWFVGKEYRFLYGDSGKRRLENMNENLRVDEKWLKEQKRILDRIERSIHPNKVVGL